jgi:hypothetical protein
MKAGAGSRPSRGFVPRTRVPQLVVNPRDRRAEPGRTVHTVYILMSKRRIP